MARRSCILAVFCLCWPCLAAAAESVEPAVTYQLVSGSKKITGYYPSPEAAWSAYEAWRAAENDRHPESRSEVSNFRPCPPGWAKTNSWNGQSVSFCHDYVRFENGQPVGGGTTSVISRGYACPLAAKLNVKLVAPSTLTVSCDSAVDFPRTLGCCEIGDPMIDFVRFAAMIQGTSCYRSYYAIWDEKVRKTIHVPYCFTYRERSVPHGTK